MTPKRLHHCWVSATSGFTSIISQFIDPAPVGCGCGSRYGGWERLVSDYC